MLNNQDYVQNGNKNCQCKKNIISLLCVSCDRCNNYIIGTEKFHHCIDCSIISVKKKIHLGLTYVTNVS